MRSFVHLLVPALAVTAACQQGGSAGSSQEASGGMQAAPAAAAPSAARGEPGSPAAAPPPSAPAPVAELKEGDPAPAFSATGDDGKTYALADLKGKFVVLYFYPKDDTPGCTIEAKGFRDDATRLSEKGAIVLGVSTDDAASHKAFREKYQLNFPLLTGGAEIAKAYNVPLNGGMATRQTFVIGKDGKIVKFFPRVNPTGHSAEIFALLQ